MWQTGGGDKQSTGRGGPSLTEDMQTERERQLSVYTSSCVMLITNSSNDEEETQVIRHHNDFQKFCIEMTKTRYFFAFFFIAYSLKLSTISSFAMATTNDRYSVNLSSAR